MFYTPYEIVFVSCGIYTSVHVRFLPILAAGTPITSSSVTIFENKSFEYCSYSHRKPHDEKKVAVHVDKMFDNGKSGVAHQNQTGAGEGVLLT